MKEVIKCDICTKEIDTKKEYAQLNHFEKKDKLLKSAYYHTSCFRDRLHGGASFRALSAKADWILDKVAEKVS